VRDAILRIEGALHEKYREEEDFSRKGGKRCRVSNDFLYAFAAVREKQFLSSKIPERI